MSNTVTLPWPPKECSPNARVHWATKFRASKKYRHDAATLVKKSRLKAPASEHIQMWIHFYPPDRRRRDDDNLIASFKPIRDGIADALEVDDSRFRIHPVIMNEVVPKGCVVVRLTDGSEIKVVTGE